MGTAVIQLMDLMLAGLAGALAVVAFMIIRAVRRSSPRSVHRVGSGFGWGRRPKALAVKCGPPLLLAAAVSMAAFFRPAANGPSMAGQASVIDGDTLEIHGERIRILDWPWEWRKAN